MNDNQHINLRDFLQSMSQPLTVNECEQRKRNQKQK